MDKQKSRIQSLDILRAIAVILVIGRHMPICPDDTPLLLSYAVRGINRVGWAGVDLFFVLSGFLVSGLLFREHMRSGQIRIVRFLSRRGLKLYPSFYVMMIVTVLANAWTKTDFETKALISECLFLQNYVKGIWNHTWSLAVEEHFYLALALLVAVMARRANDPKNPFVAIPVIFTCVALGALLMRWLTCFFVDFSHSVHMHLTFPSHLRADSLFFGVLLSYVYHYHPKQLVTLIAKYRGYVLVLSCVMLAPICFIPLGSSMWLMSFGLTIIYLAFGGIVICTVDWSPSCPRIVKRLGNGLAAMGFYSYSIYLWHMPVLGYAIKMKAANDSHLVYWKCMVVYAIGSLLVGVSMAKLIEMPVLKLRDRCFPSPSGAASFQQARQTRQL